MDCNKNCVQDKKFMKELFFSSSMAINRFASSSLPSTPFSFCLEFRSKTDEASPAKLSFGPLGDIAPGLLASQHLPKNLQEKSFIFQKKEEIENGRKHL